jgi:branched-chain amino acid transport system substrate-binding protein
MRIAIAAAALAALILGAGPAAAADAPGVTAREIKLGQTMSLTGIAARVARPLAASEQAYFRMINAEGGIDGRKIVLETLDDGFDPKKALALVRKMVEQDHVAAIFGAFATPQNIAIRGYLNAHGVPDLFIATGDDSVIDPRRFPWTIGGIPVFRIEAQIFGRYILVNMPKAKVGILSSADLMGASYLLGLHQGLGRLYAQHVVKEVAVPDGATSAASLLPALRAAGADTLIVAAQPPVVASVIRLAHAANWHPAIFIDFAASTGLVLEAAGPVNAKGIMTANSYLDPTDPRWTEDGTIKPFTDFVAKYLPHSNGDVGYYLAGYVDAQAMVQVLRQCGNDLSRNNIMLQAANLRNFHPVGLLPGVTFFTSRTKYLPIVEAALQRFNGRHWVQFGEVMAGF